MGSGGATEWSNGQVINLGDGIAYAINNAGQVVGTSAQRAIEWSNGSVIDLGPGRPTGIDDAGRLWDLALGPPSGLMAMSST